MLNKEVDILIIGAGLTGLCLAYYLRNSDLKISILEARDRVGGRILTNTSQVATIEMGATWFSEQHKEVLALLKELNLDVFRQELGTSAMYEPNPNGVHQVVPLPHNQEPSYRIGGGSFKLIEALIELIDPSQVSLNQIVEAIVENGDYLVTNTNEITYTSKWVISTLPPYLLINSIDFSPELPSAVTEISSNTHTWMGESIKVGLSYKSPFWKEKGLTGTIFANSGPITEMYDHTNYDESNYALKGFLNPALHSIGKADRRKAVLDQLEKYYGSRVRDYIDYHELLWMNEPYTYQPYPGHMFPHQNNGHSLYRSSYLNDKMILAGTETASVFPGYMEGAVRSAQEVFKKIQSSI